MITSVDAAALDTGFFAASAKRASSMSITKMLSEITIQVEVSFVNWGLKLKPSVVKNSTDLLRFFTGRFTKILLAIV
jgi:hypothetical protein